MRISSNKRYGNPLYIVDGYNVILNGRFSSHSRSIPDARDFLLRLLDSYISRKMVEIIVVWDGTGSVPNGLYSGTGVRSIYSNKCHSADEKIVTMVERMKNRGRITVVSNDRRHITGIVKNLGAKSMSVDEFLSLIRFMPLKGKGFRDEDSPDISDLKNSANDLSVDDWLRLFRSNK